MRWLYIKDIEELKAMGNMKCVKNVIKDDLRNFFKKQNSKEKNVIEMIKITSSSWVGLYDKIIALREFIHSCENISYNEKILKGTDIDYFKSEEDELIFYILETDGKLRSKKLGVTRECFTNKNKAREWRNNIYKKIHPDKSSNKKANEASAKLNQLYKEMIE